jgi:hypothetical protein
MPPVGFVPTMREFERAKTVHALDRAATVVGESEEGRERIAQREN